MERVSCRRCCQGGRSGFGKEDKKIAVLCSYSVFPQTVGDRSMGLNKTQSDPVCFLLWCSHLYVEWPGVLPSLFLQGKMALRSLGYYNRAGVCGYCQTLKGSLTLNGTQADSHPSSHTMCPLHVTSSYHSAPGSSTLLSHVLFLVYLQREHRQTIKIYILI